MRYPLVLLFTTLLIGCPDGGYHPNYANATNYVVTKQQGVRTLGNVLVVVQPKDKTDALLTLIDQQVTTLDICLMGLGRPKVQRDWCGVLIPPDWYVSSCSNEQLVPSRVDPKLCEAKGLKIPEQCWWVTRPSVLCLCPCNFRAIIQDNYWIVTTPNLKLFKAELLRLVTGVSNVWTDEKLRMCLP